MRTCKLLVGTGQSKQQRALTAPRSDPSLNMMRLTYTLLPPFCVGKGIKQKLKPQKLKNFANIPLATLPDAEYHEHEPQSRMTITTN